MCGMIIFTYKASTKAMKTVRLHNYIVLTFRSVNKDLLLYMLRLKVDGIVMNLQRQILFSS